MSILLGIAVLFFGMTIGLMPVAIVIFMYGIICLPGQAIFAYGYKNGRENIETIGMFIAYLCAAYYSSIYTITMVLLARGLSVHTSIPAWSLFVLAFLHADLPALYASREQFNEELVAHHVVRFMWPVTVSVYFLSVFWPTPIQWAFAWMPYISSLG